MQKNGANFTQTRERLRYLQEKVLCSFEGSWEDNRGHQSNIRQDKFGAGTAGRTLSKYEREKREDLIV